MDYEESKIQVQIVKFLQEQKIWCYSVPNERKCSPQAMGRLISMGLKKGVSDLVLWLGDKTIYLEVKKPSGVQSVAQVAFQKRCERYKRPYYVVRSVSDVKKVLKIEGFNVLE